jgi:hypothetical protein
VNKVTTIQPKLAISTIAAKTNTAKEATKPEPTQHTKLELIHHRTS